MKALANRLEKLVKTPKARKSSAKKAVAGGNELSAEDMYQRIAQKAYELYVQRGYTDGCDLDDWYRAEQMVQEELKKIY